MVKKMEGTKRIMRRKKKLKGREEKGEENYRVKRE